MLAASTKPDGKFLIKVGKLSSDASESIDASYLLIATGSSQQVILISYLQSCFIVKGLIYIWFLMLQGHSLATRFCHSIVDPVPSLFTFKINDPSLTELAGVNFPLKPEFSSTT